MHFSALLERITLWCSHISLVRGLFPLNLNSPTRDGMPWQERVLITTAGSQISRRYFS
jgi:hypothetical protein